MFVSRIYETKRFVSDSLACHFDDEQIISYRTASHLLLVLLFSAIATNWTRQAPSLLFHSTERSNHGNYYLSVSLAFHETEHRTFYVNRREQEVEIEVETELNVTSETEIEFEVKLRIEINVEIEAEEEV